MDEILKAKATAYSNVKRMRSVADELKLRGLARNDPQDVCGNLLALASTLSANAAELRDRTKSRREKDAALENIRKVADVLEIWRVESSKRK